MESSAGVVAGGVYVCVMLFNRHSSSFVSSDGLSELSVLLFVVLTYPPFVVYPSAYNDGVAPDFVYVIFEVSAFVNISSISAASAGILGKSTEPLALSYTPSPSIVSVRIPADVRFVKNLEPEKETEVKKDVSNKTKME